MNISEVTLLVILSILCNSDLTYQFQWQSVANSYGRANLNWDSYLTSNFELICTLRGTHEHVGGLDRRRRALNETASEKELVLVEEGLRSNGSSEEEARAAEHALLVRNFTRTWPVARWRAGGYFDDDYLELINEHWLRFPPPPDWLQKTLGSVYLLFSCVGCWGNVIVLFMYFR